MSQIDWAACERLVGSLASKFHQDGLELDDIKQEARLAVLEHHASYSPEMGVSYNTFIGRRIRDALRSFVGANNDSVEVSREWVAESIAEGPSGAIRAKTKAECEGLRTAQGAERFKKPRRVIETMRATVSLDEVSGSDGDDDITLHEALGHGPEQESMIAASEAIAAAKVKSQESAALARNGGAGDYWQDISALRTAGYTFEQIGGKLGKSSNAIKKAWGRAQKSLGKSAA